MLNEDLVKKKKKKKKGTDTYWTDDDSDHPLHETYVKQGKQKQS